MNKTKYIKVEKTKNFTVINNEIIKRKDLSWKAKGIMIYILSLPDDWVINLNEVMKNATDGKASFRSGWKELTDLGYVERKPVYKDGLINYWETIVWESLEHKQTQLLTDYLEVENLEVENLEVDNRNLLSTNNTKYLNIQSTDNTKDIVEKKKEQEKLKKEQREKEIAKVINYLNEKAKKNFNLKAPSNIEHINARLNEGYTVDDFIKVIDIKTAEWLNDKKMNKYLRPTTLFIPKNFDAYLNEESEKEEMPGWEDIDFGLTLSN